MAAKAVKSASLLLGRCVPCAKQNASKIKVPVMAFDENLLMYFKDADYVFAHDPTKVCKTGDIVLVRKLPEKLTTLITHKIEKVVYKMGDVVDPITGKSVVASEYREQIEAANELFGKSESGFDYNKAPPRGWQEGKRDFTDKETFRKYHVDGVDDPYAV